MSFTWCVHSVYQGMTGVSAQGPRFIILSLTGNEILRFYWWAEPTTPAHLKRAGIAPEGWNTFVPNGIPLMLWRSDGKQCLTYFFKKLPFGFWWALRAKDHRSFFFLLFFSFILINSFGERSCHVEWAESCDTDNLIGLKCLLKVLALVLVVLKLFILFLLH